jgi:DNA-binding NtrC family response regulator
MKSSQFIPDAGPFGIFDLIQQAWPHRPSGANAGSATRPLRPVRSLAPRLTTYVVDEFPGLAELAKMLLETAGFPARAFDDRCQAMRAFTSGGPRPALLIADDSDGDGLGIRLIRQCKALEPQLRTLWVSHRPSSILRESDRLLVNGFLRKPYCGPLLIDEVRRLCGLIRFNEK